MGGTQTYHKHFTFATTATQNVVDIPVGSRVVKQPAHDATQIPDLCVPFLFKFCQDSPLRDDLLPSANRAIPRNAPCCICLYVYQALQRPRKAP